MNATTNQRGLSLFGAVSLIGLMAAVLWGMLFATSLGFGQRETRQTLPLGQAVELHTGDRVNLPGGQSRLTVYDVAYRAPGEEFGAGALAPNVTLLADGPSGPAILALAGPDAAPALTYGAFRLHILGVIPASATVTMAVERLP